MGGPAVVTPSKEGKQKNASKKEVQKLEGYNLEWIVISPILSSNASVPGYCPKIQSVCQ